MTRRLGTSLCVLALALSVVGQRPIQRLNQTGFNPSGTNQSDGIGVAQGAGMFVTVWAEQNGTTSATQDIWAAVSTDDGLTFGAAVRVDIGDAPNAADSDEPKVVVCDDGTIVVVWEEKRDANANGSSNEDVFYSVSTNGGQSFATAAPLNLPTSGSHIASDIDRISIDQDGNTIVCCWEEDSLSAIGQAEEIWFTKSTDSGATWSAPVIINSQVGPHSNGTWPHNDPDDPCIRLDGQTIVLAMIDDRTQIAGANQDDVWVLSSPDCGQNWLEQSIETNNAGDVDEPLCAIDGNLAVVIWEDAEVGLGDAIHASISLDGGITWSPEVVMSPTVETAAGTQAFWADVAVQGSNIYVSWVDDSANGGGGQSGSQAYVSVSNDSGATFTLETRLDMGNTTRANRTQVIATDQVAYVHFETGTDGSNSLAYGWSTNFGLSWNWAGVPGTGPDVDTDDQNEGRFLAVDPVTHVAVSAVHDRPLGQNEVYFSGIRQPRLELDGVIAPGNPMNLAVRDVPIASVAGATFLVGVGQSGSSPSSFVAPGLQLHLVVDMLALNLVNTASTAPIVSGNIAGSGEGLGAIFPWPGVPTGTTFYAAAGVFDNVGTLRFLTDPLVIVAP